MRQLAVVALLVVLGCGGDGGDAEVCTGGWHVCRGQIRDADGRAVILRGINIANANKTAPYLSAHTDADFARLRDDWGMNAVRWVMPWAAVEPEQGVYDDAYLDAVRMRLDWAAAHDLLVILDMHQDVYGEGFGANGAPRWTCDQRYYDAFVPREPWPINYLDPNVMACFDQLWTDPALGEAFAAAWGHVAARLGDHPAVLGFDIINEPHWGTYGISDFERDLLQPFEERAIAAVRAEAPGWIAFAEPSSSRNLGVATSLQPFAATDVVYAPHAYDPVAEQGDGFDPAKRDDFIGNIEHLRREADRLGAALWIGEYGGLQSDPQVTAYLDAGFDGAVAALGSMMYWEYGRGGYSPLDADGNEVAAITTVLARPYPERIAGDPLDWSYDEAAGVTTLHWEPDATIAAPTVIAVPPRLAPVTVECGGCTVVTTAHGVELTGGDGSAVITNGQGR